MLNFNLSLPSVLLWLNVNHLFVILGFTVVLVYSSIAFYLECGVTIFTSETLS